MGVGGTDYVSSVKRDEASGMGPGIAEEMR